MALTRTIVLAACLLTASVARAQDAEPPSSVVPDVVYKGLVGKALDVVPMDPEQRVALQRTNAVVSNTLTARSVSVWVGLTNPVLLVAGLAWGVYAALNIKAPQVIAKPDVKRVEPIKAGQIELALAIIGPPAEDNAALNVEAPEAMTNLDVKHAEPIESARIQFALAIIGPPTNSTTEAAQ